MAEEIDEYRIAVALTMKLHQLTGDTFQQFFADVMQMKYGEDFVRVTANGIGDQGCDGFLRSTGTVYQCYGAVSGSTKNVNRLRSKIETDLGKAIHGAGQGLQMEEWCFVHNLNDGLPTSVVTLIQQLQASHSIKISLFSKPKFQEIILSLSTTNQNILLGPIATNEDSLSVHPEELRALMEHIMATIDEGDPCRPNIQPVPREKLASNKLSNYWYNLIEVGRKHIPIIEKHFARSHEPLTGTTITQTFNKRYVELRSSDLTPDTIMTEIYEFVTGKGQVSPKRQVAAQALLAYLFEMCEIFEPSDGEDSNDSTQ